MQLIKRWLTHTLGFSHAQTTGFLVLLPLIFLIIFSSTIYRSLQPKHLLDQTAANKKLDSLIAVWESKVDTIRIEEKKSLFAFNPNTATKEELLSLGFTTSLASRLLNYRSKGGVFRKETDLLKLYGMDSMLYSQLAPFIQLPSGEIAAKNYPPKQKAFVATKREFTRFDINEADTTQLKAIYGIGSKLATRVVRYRSSLGGFISTQQLYEVWGLDSIVVNHLIQASFIDLHFNPTTLKVNKATEKELATHPYLSKTIAKSIVTYRFQHGKFSSPSDLEKVQTLDMRTIQKIAPYLSFE